METSAFNVLVKTITGFVVPLSIQFYSILLKILLKKMAFNIIIFW